MEDIRDSLGQIIKKRVKGKDEEINVLVSAVRYKNEVWTWSKAWFDLDTGLLYTPDRSRLLIENQDYYYKDNQLWFY